ncbi:hypothetical protein ABMA28_017302, partial [Loxostege sticticalis]
QDSTGRCLRGKGLGLDLQPIGRDLAFLCTNPYPPLPADLPDLEDKKPEEELTVSENETSHSENNLHDDDKDILHLLNLPENNSTETEEEEEEERLTTTPETTSSSTTTTSTTTTTTTEATT